MSTPATLGLRGSRTKFDEFQSVHILKMEIAHFTVRGVVVDRFVCLFVCLDISNHV